MVYNFTLPQNNTFSLLVVILSGTAVLV